jgi:hypothetical protein
MTATVAAARGGCVQTPGTNDSTALSRSLAHSLTRSLTGSLELCYHRSFAATAAAAPQASRSGRQRHSSVASLKATTRLQQFVSDLRTGARRHVLRVMPMLAALNVAHRNRSMGMDGGGGISGGGGIGAVASAAFGMAAGRPSTHSAVGGRGGNSGSVPAHAQNVAVTIALWRLLLAFLRRHDHDDDEDEDDGGNVDTVNHGSNDNGNGSGSGGTTANTTRAAGEKGEGGGGGGGGGGGKNEKAVPLVAAACSRVLLKLPDWLDLSNVAGSVADVCMCMPAVHAGVACGHGAVRRKCMRSIAFISRLC